MKKLQKRAKVAPYISKKLKISFHTENDGSDYSYYQITFHQGKSFWPICIHTTEESAKFCRKKLIKKLRQAASRRTRS